VNVEGQIAAVRSWRQGRLGSVGLVPTMGYLHAGHLSLVETARRENDRVAVTIFVNPTQFGAGEDLSTYPRDESRDLDLLRGAGVDLVFLPAATEIYPPGFDSWVEPGEIATRLEGRSRPGHFRGVCTVVLKLINIVSPDRAYFGQKDAQQVQMIRKMVADLDVPVQITVLPTVREADGLAMSSRNSYLDPAQRRAALVLSRGLSRAAALWHSGSRDAAALRRTVEQTVAAEPLARLDYVSVANGTTLEELSCAPAGTLVSLAVRFGAVRLIDNTVLGGPTANDRF